MIREFDKQTGLPMLLNTSVNDAGEPIVNSPEDVIRSAKRTNLDALVMGSFLVQTHSEGKN